MKDIISERLIQLSSSLESMTEIEVIMDQWESSQSIVEKYAYDAINVSDTVLNLSKEGNSLITKLQEAFYGCCSSHCPEEAKQMAVILEEMKSVFKNVLETSTLVSQISHNIEKEYAFQKEIKENMTHSIGLINESVESAVACAEFMLAEM